MPSEIPVIASMWSLVETSDTKYSTQYMYLMAKYDGSCSKVFNCVEHFKIVIIKSMMLITIASCDGIIKQ